MLGKVLKHEFKSTGKLLVPLNLILIGITIIGMVVLRLNVFSNDSMALLAIGFMLLYILGLLAVAIVSFIYIAIRFYKSMFGAEGYLTHTLPVSNMAILNSKLLVALCWYTICIMLTIISVVSLICAGFSGMGTPIVWSVILSQIELVAGVSVPVLAVWILGLIIVSSLSGILMIYASLSIGQLFNKYKVPAAIVAYIVLYIINQVISTLITMKISVDSIDESIVLTTTATGSATLDMAGIYGPLALTSVVEALIFAVVYYIITYFICKKKLNLD